FHYMSAVAYLIASQYQQSIAAARKVASAFSAEAGSIEAAECGYLAGLAHLRQQDIPAASVEFQQVVDGGKESASADHARALLANIRFSRGSYEEAIELWKGLDNSKCKEWRLDPVLRQTVFLAAVQALKSHRYEPAAKH